MYMYVISHTVESYTSSYWDYNVETNGNYRICNSAKISYNVIVGYHPRHIMC